MDHVRLDTFENQPGDRAQEPRKSADQLARGGQSGSLTRAASCFANFGLFDLQSVLFIYFFIIFALIATRSKKRFDNNLMNENGEI